LLSKKSLNFIGNVKLCFFLLSYKFDLSSNSHHILLEGTEKSSWVLSIHHVATLIMNSWPKLMHERGASQENVLKLKHIPTNVREWIPTFPRGAITLTHAINNRNQCLILCISNGENKKLWIGFFFYNIIFNILMYISKNLEYI
jgi:hypothetical protein